MEVDSVSLFDLKRITKIILYLKTTQSLQ